jgi:hypothetical protein
MKIIFCLHGPSTAMQAAATTTAPVMKKPAMKKAAMKAAKAMEAMKAKD